MLQKSGCLNHSNSWYVIVAHLFLGVSFKIVNLNIIEVEGSKSIIMAYDPSIGVVFKGLDIGYFSSSLDRYHVSLGPCVLMFNTNKNLT